MRERGAAPWQEVRERGACARARAAAVRTGLRGRAARSSSAVGVEAAKCSSWGGCQRRSSAGPVESNLASARRGGRGERGEALRRAAAPCRCALPLAPRSPRHPTASSGQWAVGRSDASVGAHLQGHMGHIPMAHSLAATAARRCCARLLRHTFCTRLLRHTLLRHTLATAIVARSECAAKRSSRRPPRVLSDRGDGVLFYMGATYVSSDGRVRGMRRGA